MNKNRKLILANNGVSLRWLVFLCLISFAAQVNAQWAGWTERAERLMSIVRLYRHRRSCWNLAQPSGSERRADPARNG